MNRRSRRSRDRSPSPRQSRRSRDRSSSPRQSRRSRDRSSSPRRSRDRSPSSSCSSRSPDRSSGPRRSRVRSPSSRRSRYGRQDKYYASNKSLEFTQGTTEKYPSPPTQFGVISLKLIKSTEHGYITEQEANLVLEIDPASKKVVGGYKEFKQLCSFISDTLMPVTTKEWAFSVHLGESPESMTHIRSDTAWQSQMQAANLTKSEPCIYVIERARKPPPQGMTINITRDGGLLALNLLPRGNDKAVFCDNDTHDAVEDAESSTTGTSPQQFKKKLRTLVKAAKSWKNMVIIDADGNVVTEESASQYFDASPGAFIFSARCGSPGCVSIQKDGGSFFAYKRWVFKSEDGGVSEIRSIAASGYKYHYKEEHNSVGMPPHLRMRAAGTTENEDISTAFTRVAALRQMAQSSSGQPATQQGPTTAPAPSPRPTSQLTLSPELFSGSVIQFPLNNSEFGVPHRAINVNLTAMTKDRLLKYKPEGKTKTEKRRNARFGVYASSVVDVLVLSSLSTRSPDGVTVCLESMFANTLYRCSKPGNDSVLQEMSKKFSDTVDFLVIPLEINANFGCSLLVVESNDPYTAVLYFAVSDENGQHRTLVDKIITWIKTQALGFESSLNSENPISQVNIRSQEIKCPSTAGTSNSGPAAVKNLEWLVTNLEKIRNQSQQDDPQISIKYEDGFSFLAYRKKKHEILIEHQSAFAKIIQQGSR